MKFFQSTIILCVLFTVFQSKLLAQKVGFANISLILAYMPEAQTMEQNLSTYQEELATSLKAKEDSLSVKAQSYIEAAGSIESLSETQRNELQTLNQSFQASTAEAEQKLVNRRQSLLEPILEKMDNAIKALATEQGYTYILNSFDGLGTSIILHSSESDDVTKKLMERLDIKIPQEEQN